MAQNISIYNTRVARVKKSANFKNVLPTDRWNPLKSIIYSLAEEILVTFEAVVLLNILNFVCHYII